uniref:Transposase n=1 Tax=Panagrolaimus sp. ES5 TaxID=591445 RepID=A0AC34FFD8_9BILA
MEKYAISDDPNARELLKEGETFELFERIPEYRAQREATLSQSESTSKTEEEISVAEEACEDGEEEVCDSDDNVSLRNHDGDEKEKKEKKKEKCCPIQYITGEFLLFFERLGLKMNNKVDPNVIYKAMCRRCECDKKLAYFCDSFEYHYIHINLENPLLTNLDYFDKVSETTLVEGWTAYWINDVSRAFHVSTANRKTSDSVGIVILSTLITLEIFNRYPTGVVLRGRYIYLNGDALKFFVSILDDSSLKTELLQDINERYGKEDITETVDLLHYCMSLGLGWMSAGKHGKMLHNHIIKSFVIDDLPYYLQQLKPYQICQFVINSVCGESDGFAITEHFTLCNEENWKKLYFVFTDDDVRAQAFQTYINERILMLANQILCNKILVEFNKIQDKRKNVRENIDECSTWLKDFDEYVDLEIEES